MSKLVITENKKNRFLRHSNYELRAKNCIYCVMQQILGELVIQLNHQIDTRNEEKIIEYVIIFMQSKVSNGQSLEEAY